MLPSLSRKLMEMYSKAFGVPEEERIKLGKEIWKIVIDEQWSIGIAGLSPAAMGIRVVKVDMGNVPSRHYNSPDTKTPSETARFSLGEPAGVYTDDTQLKHLLCQAIIKKGGRVSAEDLAGAHDRLVLHTCA